jgi:hypothetical protein
VSSVPGGRWDANGEPGVTDDTNNPSEEISEYARKNGLPSGNRRTRYSSALKSGPAAAIRARTRGVRAVSVCVGNATKAAGSRSVKDAPRDCSGTPSLSETSVVREGEAG